MMRFVLVALLVGMATPCVADFAADFKDKVRALDEKYQDIDKRIGLLIAGDKADFKKYAEVRNELIRFIVEPRRETQYARSIGDQNSSQRVQAEQELKIILSDLTIDLNDDDGKPLPFSALSPRIETAMNEAKEQLDQENKALLDIVRDRSSNMSKLRDSETGDEDKKAIRDVLRKIQEDMQKARSSVASVKVRIDQFRKAKDLLTKAIEYTNFSLQFGPEVERLEAMDSRANRKIQQIDEAIFNLLLSESNDKRYTLYATLVFGVAVVIVIGAFFFVAYKSEAIRASIFANDSGLQFVTLFSLVIAIILFGVLKILEGRELAALLGGLSGYILGRGGISRQSTTAVVPPVVNTVLPQGSGG